MPDITDDTPTKIITVQSFSLEAPSPYSEGHELDANEAAVLNQTFHENLRNNFANLARKTIEKAGGVENVDTAKLQDEFWAYAVGYSFDRTTGRTADPVMAEALRNAIEQVKSTLKDKGYKLKDVPNDKIRELAQRAIEANPAWMEHAKQVINARQARAKELTVEVD